MPGFPELINQAREHLHSIRVHPSPEPDPDSPARRAFDPYVARRLNTFIPIRVIDVPTAEDTWSAMDRFLEGWEELSVLSLTGEISTWDVRAEDGVVLRNIHSNCPVTDSWEPSGVASRCTTTSSLHTIIYPGKRFHSEFSVLAC